ncbi:hypothetical protein SMD44_00948 [Streptomyces alboflavus]|uniref:Uncharacterized protein n=1 Tax=Streptomyces alboflavus TaxID=67267 RepID=A0A1Z1W566_9ACTN|nr:hypothetical protein [Streptomyces alboflavus]ARX81550.1 hypothetical protein SMD44_00948 [Streptomyces alboflavus]
MSNPGFDQREFHQRQFEEDEQVLARINAGEELDVEAALMDAHLRASVPDEQ